MDNRTVELVKTAENRQYTKFEEVAKEILKDKVKQSQAFQEFKEKMETIYEACGKKLAEAPKDSDIDADDEDNDGKKDSEEDHGDLPKDFKGDHKKAEKEKEDKED
jgi:hypothetical protein